MTRSTGDPAYWQKTHEPLNVALNFVVRQFWTKNPPIDDLQLQYIPHYAGKHCLQTVRLSRLANEGGAHAAAVGLLRDAVEALSVVALAVSHHPDKLGLLTNWNEEKVRPGDLRKHLEREVWPTISTKGLWGQPWSSFWADFSSAVQPYAHFTPLRMRWHQRIEIIDGKWHFWINHPDGDFELYRGARIVAFQLLVFWAFAELLCAFDAAPDDVLRRIRSLACDARQWLEKNEVFFHGEKWEVQLMPFIYPTESRYWEEKP